MKPIIEVDHLSKKYRLGALHQPYHTVRDTIKSVFNSFKQKKADEFYALRDVSFTINPGESVGIIGKNGAGKSTLLKILSRITTPTTGKILLRGRVASLLEVGTGFHGELTGRENIFFNGAILGMKKKEIQLKFDEIVDFSGVEKFMDTPLKHYSSGMQLRLAFAVAAFLEPEILLIDEVLAVGDAEFQKKCLGKMQDISDSGRTVFFVSHNMAAIATLCNKGLYLSGGELHAAGKMQDIIKLYKADVNQTARNISVSPGIFDISIHPNKTYDRKFGIQKVRLYCNGELSNSMFSGCEMKFECILQNKVDITNPLVGFVIKNDDGTPIIGINNKHLGVRLNNSVFNNGIFSCIIPGLPLYGNRTYFVDLYWGNNDECFDIVLDAFNFSVEPSDVYNTAHILDERLNTIIVPKIKFDLTIER